MILIRRVQTCLCQVELSANERYNVYCRGWFQTFKQVAWSPCWAGANSSPKYNELQLLVRTGRDCHSLTERCIYGVCTCSCQSKSHLPSKADETCRSAQRTWYTVGKQRTKLGSYPRSCVQIGSMNSVLLDPQKCPSSYLIWPRHFVALLSREEGSKSSLRSLSAVKVKFDWSTCRKSSLLLIWYVLALAVSAQFHDKEIPENKEIGSQGDHLTFKSV